MQQNDLTFLLSAFPSFRLPRALLCACREPGVLRAGRNNLTSALFPFSAFRQCPHLQKPRSCLEEMGRGLGGGAPSLVSSRGREQPPGVCAWSSWELGDPFQQPGSTVYMYFTWIFLFPPSTALLPYLNASMSLFIGILSSLA